MLVEPKYLCERRRSLIGPAVVEEAGQITIEPFHLSMIQMPEAVSAPANRLRVGYVGGGFLAQKVHLPNLVSLADECELVAIAEVRPRLGRLIQERYDIPSLYPDHLSLAAAEDVDAIFVSGHFSGQGDIARDLLLAGKSVFVEKPVALSVEQLDELVAAERSGGGRLMVGYMKRYDRGNRKARDLVRLRTADLGEITYVRAHGFGGDWVAASSEREPLTTEESYPAVTARFPRWLPAWLETPYLAYAQQWTHNLNLVRFLLDSTEPVRVRTVDLTCTEGSWDVRGIVSLEVAGARTVIEAGTIASDGWHEHTQVFFRSGWIKTTAPPLLLDGASADVEVFDGREGLLTYPCAAGPATWAYREEARAFLQALRTDAEFESSLQDAAVDVAAFEEIFRLYVAQEARG